MSTQSGDPETQPGRRPPEGTQAVQRALTLLERLRSGPGTLAEIADGEGLARPTAHRLLAALESRRLVERRGILYAAGPALAEWGARSLHARPGSWPEPSPLHPRQVLANQSTSWTDWSGFAMPASYERSHHREYWAVRGSAGLFDVSALYKYDFVGEGAAALAQRLLTRDVARCRVGQVMYGCWCDDQGDVLQDGNLWRLAEDHFRISAAEPCLRWFEDCSFGIAGVEVQEVSRQIAALALQGPRSRAILEQALETSLADLGFFRGARLDWRGGELGITRTGYTGDLGYELWVDSRRALELWDDLCRAGADHAMLPAGLQALDATRIEAGLVLLDVDYFSADHALTESRKSTPFDLGLGWAVQLNDGNDFVGRAALERRPRNWTVCGVEIDWSELERLHRPRGVRPLTVGGVPDRRPVPLRRGGRQVGQITSQCFSPLLKRQIGIASVQLDALADDDGDGPVDASALAGRRVEVWLDIERERIPATARLCALPHYDPPQKRQRFDRPAGARR
ncbi:MAG: aminomethyl transferase family protein [Acidobacteria bacterium]|nr:MAG: aminomethyl transferase family protein [Acidobacteriota bacterium]REK10514.1 MAG: aminomethyl transferase family protein [Acidobacteriota bacterium]